MAMTSEERVQFWVESSDANFDSMIAMFESKQYQWSLFVGHLAIEKLLKAIYEQKYKQAPPFIHNLMKLTEFVKLK